MKRCIWIISLFCFSISSIASELNKSNLQIKDCSRHKNNPELCRLCCKYQSNLYSIVRKYCKENDLDKQLTVSESMQLKSDLIEYSRTLKKYQEPELNKEFYPEVFSSKFCVHQNEYLALLGSDSPRKCFDQCKMR